MGAIGTKGVNGTYVATTSLGTAGTFDETYYIPANLKGSSRISIRLESKQGYYAYDWFTNVSGTSGSGTSNESSSAATAVPTVASSNTGYPTTEILSVVKDSSVALRVKNMQANQDYRVTMGPFGSKGVGGTYVATTSSNSGGTFDVTYNIPDNLKGTTKIAIRLESTQGNYAYDWFSNN